MNRPFGVPPLGGQRAPDRLKLQTLGRLKPELRTRLPTV
jgi:hypothetical protein